MNILAIESSCDETAAAVVKDGRHILSSCVASQIEQHQRFGGVVPEIASRLHAESIAGLTREAMREAGVGWDGIDAIAVTHAPGLIGALLVGVNFAKGLAYSTGLPLIAVHHLRSHIAANYLAHPALQPPFLCLVVSGGHTHIVAVRDYTTFEVLGRTRDDAAGECFDKAARAMGLPYPGGVHLDALARTGDSAAFRLPRPRVEDSRLDFSFSGLKTAVLNLLHHAQQTGQALSTADVCASLQETVAGLLVEHTMRAAAMTGFSTVAMAGGVCANSGLRRKMEEACRSAGYALYMPPLPLCGDNAAMVGAQAFYEWRAGRRADLSLNACATRAIEEG